MATSLVLTGASGNYASRPDAAAISSLSNFTVEADVAADDWTPTTSSNYALGAHSTATGNQRSWSFLLLQTGILRLNVGTNGSGLTSYDSTVAPTVADGARLRVRAIRDSTTGTVQFWTSTDGVSYTQLGTDVAGALTGTLFNSTAAITVGADDAGASRQFIGKMYRFRIWSDKTQSTLIFDANFTGVAVTAVRTPTTITDASSNAATVTVNGSAWNWQNLATSSLGGTLTPSGTAQRTNLKALAGAVTPAGAILRAIAKTLAGTVTPAGTVIKTWTHALAGTVTPAGAALKNAGKALAGSTVSSGALQRTIAKSLTATSTPSGTIVKAIVRFWGGTVTPAGSALKTVGKPLAGTTSTSGGLLKTAGKTVAGTVTPSGGLIRSIAKTLSGAVTSAGTVVRSTARGLTGDITSSGGVVKTVAKLFAGAVPATGTTVKTTAKGLGGTVTPSGEVTGLSVITLVFESLAGTVTAAGHLLVEFIKSTRDRRTARRPEHMSESVRPFTASHAHRPHTSSSGLRPSASSASERPVTSSAAIAREVV